MAKILREKYTWHHLDDLDKNGKSGFELIHREVHRQTKQHVGSHYLI